MYSTLPCALQVFSCRRLPQFYEIISVQYAMQILQAEMAGEAETAGLTSEEDILAMVHEMRNEETNA